MLPVLMVTVEVVEVLMRVEVVEVVMRVEVVEVVDWRQLPRYRAPGSWCHSWLSLRDKKSRPGLTGRPEPR